MLMATSPRWGPDSNHSVSPEKSNWGSAGAPRAAWPAALFSRFLSSPLAPWPLPSFRARSRASNSASSASRSRPASAGGSGGWATVVPGLGERGGRTGVESARAAGSTVTATAAPAAAAAGGGGRRRGRGGARREPPPPEGPAAPLAARVETTRRRAPRPGRCGAWGQKRDDAPSSACGWVERRVGIEGEAVGWEASMASAAVPVRAAARSPGDRTFERAERYEASRSTPSLLV